jgi:hypothetical protein
MNFNITITHEHRPDTETRRKIDRILQLLTQFRLEERIMDLALQEKFAAMEAEVSAIGTVVDSNDALLDNLAKMLADALANSTNLEEIKTKVGDITAMIIEKKDKLSAAVVEHTPAAPQPEPPIV